jgi:hypothetical protein
VTKRAPVAVAAASHFPQIEQLAEVERLISAFADGL